MKIAIVGSRGLAPHVGGIESYLTELCQNLAKRGHEITIYGLKKYDEGIDIEGVKKTLIDCVYTSSLEGVTTTLLSILSANRGEYDIVHLHGPAASLFSFLPVNSKKVLTVHGLARKGERWGNFAKAFLRLGERFATKFPQETIVVSEYLKDCFMEKYGKETHFIPQGIESYDYAEPNLIKEFGLEKDNYVLALGRVVDLKGFHHVIEASKQISKDVKIVITGELNGYCQEYIRRLEELNHNSKNNVIFTGEARGDLKAELFSNALLFLSPQEVGGISRTVLEAMSYGTAVVLSDVCSYIPDFSDACFLHRNKDPNDLANVVNRLLSNRERIHTKAQQAKSYIRQAHRWGPIVDAHEALYQQLLNPCDALLRM